LGIEAYTFHPRSFFECIDAAARLGLSFVGGLASQKVSADLPRNFDETLGDEELARIREKLDLAGLRLVTYSIRRIPVDEAGAKRVFEFGRKMGIETFLSEPLPEDLDRIERLAEEYGIQVALHNNAKDASPHAGHPDEILKLCRGRGKMIGACVDTGSWMRAGIDPCEGLRKLGDRVIAVQLHDLDRLAPEGHDVPWGAGAGGMEGMLREFHRLGIRPAMFGLEYSHDGLDNEPEVAASAAFFAKTATAIASGGK
jgi:sugar phosphate isomerase/epimerase